MGAGGWVRDSAAARQTPDAGSGSGTQCGMGKAGGTERGTRGVAPSRSESASLRVVGSGLLVQRGAWTGLLNSLPQPCESPCRLPAASGMATIMTMMTRMTRMTRMTACCLVCPHACAVQGDCMVPRGSVGRGSARPDARLGLLPWGRSGSVRRTRRRTPRAPRPPHPAAPSHTSPNPSRVRPGPPTAHRPPTTSLVLGNLGSSSRPMWQGRLP